METAVLLAILGGCLSLVTLCLNKFDCAYFTNGAEHAWELSMSDQDSLNSGSTA